ncbi:hypothetical protein [Aliamphritea ceti]|uniref:hypothetical protein n=1 Tax=Aliamphritea ceti TaxID=1524258 RepID=UPI0021C31137|nr:hypothetical protein [Aliamphritea ceti]
MTKIYIHLGSHKSASTTLQKNLRMNTGVLSESYNLFYNAGQEIHTTALGVHFRKLSKFQLMDKSDYLESIGEAKKAVKEMIEHAAGKNILVSWEGFLGHSALDKYGGIYTHAERVADSLRRIFSENELRFLLVVRRQDSFIESCYLQQIKENRSLSFHEFTDGINIDSLSWLDFFLEFYKLFGNNVALCPFEYIKGSGAKGFIEYCMSSLMDTDFNASEFSISEKANASFSEEGVDISRSLLPQVSKGRRAEINKILFAEFSSRTGTKAKFFSEFEKKLILNKESESNSRLFKEFFVHKVKGRVFDLSDVNNYWNLN